MDVRGVCTPSDPGTMDISIQYRQRDSKSDEDALMLVEESDTHWGGDM